MNENTPQSQKARSELRWFILDFYARFIPYKSAEPPLGADNAWERHHADDQLLALRIVQNQVGWNTPEGKEIANRLHQGINAMEGHARTLRQHLNTLTNEGGHMQNFETLRTLRPHKP